MQSKSSSMMSNVKGFVQSYCEEFGRGPSVSLVGETVGLSKVGAFNYLNELYNNGEIGKSGNTFVSNELLRSGDSIQVPILGSIPCGPLTEMFQNPDGYMRLPTSLTGSGKFFLLKAHGDSMLNAGITDGSLVLINSIKQALKNDIVVAMVNNEVTLKRLCYDNVLERYYLHPENEKYDDIYVDNLLIQGVATKVINNL